MSYQGMVDKLETEANESFSESPPATEGHDGMFLEDLFKKNYTIMVRFTKRILTERGASPDIAEDIVQEAFLVAQNKLAAVMASPNPTGWLYKTLQNLLRDFHRRRKKLQEILEQIGSAQEQFTEDEENVFLKYEGILSREDLELLINIYCRGYEYAQEAERLNISLSACKMRIYRARTMFRKKIRENL